MKKGAQWLGRALSSPHRLHRRPTVQPVRLRPDRRRNPSGGSTEGDTGPVVHTLLVGIWWLPESCHRPDKLHVP